MVGQNKYENKLIKKKFRKSDHYLCCGSPANGNKNKYSSGHCCTFPQVFKRYDITLQNRRISMLMDDNIILYK